jgi:MFS family permease
LSCLADEFGRKPVLVGAMIVMGSARFVIGLLPSYAQIGVIAPSLLVIIRMIQGLAFGAEWGGAITMAYEHASWNRRGMYAAIPQSGNPFGIALASAMLLICANLDGDLAWRIPFLPSQARTAAGSGAVSALALITGISAIASLACPPIVGVLSDRTRTRWGRRAPWILLGGAACALSLILLGSVGAIVGLLVGWFLVQATINVGLNVILSVIPDHVPVHRHGLASTMQGLGIPIGSVLGAVAGAALVGSVVVAYVTRRALPGLVCDCGRARLREAGGRR